VKSLSQCVGGGRMEGLEEGWKRDRWTGGMEGYRIRKKGSGRAWEKGVEGDCKILNPRLSPKHRPTSLFK
jgi:hypothetical protein